MTFVEKVKEALKIYNLTCQDFHDVQISDEFKSEALNP